jgi:hypothetical protein
MCVEIGKRVARRVADRRGMSRHNEITDSRNWNGILSHRYLIFKCGECGLNIVCSRKLKALLGLDPSKVQSSYQSHEDSMKSGASYSNPAKYKL